MGLTGLEKSWVTSIRQFEPNGRNPLFFYTRPVYGFNWVEKIMGYAHIFPLNPEIYFWGKNMWKITKTRDISRQQ